MKALLVVLAALLVIAHPALLTAGLGVVLAVLEAAVFLIAHPLIILGPELAVLAVIAAGIARSAGLTLPWRTT
jgi:hypothetical protein